MNGFLNVHKPSGISSRDAVNRITKTLKPIDRKIKVGHTGTLDPLASGVLVIGVGKATSLIRWLLQGDKKYIGTFLLGKSSPTEDTESSVTEHDIPSSIDEKTLEGSLKKFRGKIQQIPPAYSALHVDGKRAYQLAREGKAVELPPREIEILDLRLLRYEPKQQSFQIDVHCSGGTYIRSLGRDIAINLGTQAVMSELVRTAAGSFSIQQSVKLEELDSPETIQKHLNPCDLALVRLPQLKIDQHDTDRFTTGLVTHHLAECLTDFWNQNEQIEENQSGDLKLQTVLISPGGTTIGVIGFREHTDPSKRWKTIVNLAGKK